MQVKVLVEFLLENCRELFGQERTEVSCQAAEEWPAPRRDAEERAGPDASQRLGLCTSDSLASLVLGLGIMACSPVSRACPLASVQPLPLGAWTLCSAR